MAQSDDDAAARRSPRPGRTPCYASDGRWANEAVPRLGRRPQRGRRRRQPLRQQQPQEHAVGAVPNLLAVLREQPSRTWCLVGEPHGYPKARPPRRPPSPGVTALSGRRATGSRTQKQPPRPAPSSTQMAPPWTPTARRQNTRPRPWLLRARSPRPPLDTSVFFEDHLAIRSRDAFALVAHANVDGGLGAVVHGRRPDVDADRRVPRAVFVGVVDQVLEHAANEVAIAAQRRARPTPAPAPAAGPCLPRGGPSPCRPRRAAPAGRTRSRAGPARRLRCARCRAGSSPAAPSTATRAPRRPAIRVRRRPAGAARARTARSTGWRTAGS